MGTTREPKKPTKPLLFRETETEGVEPEGKPDATADASALVPYTSGSDSRTHRLPKVPVHQGKRPSIVPVHQGKRLSGSYDQQPRYLQVHYEIPAGVDPVPGSPGTVLIPVQVENSSKKRKVRLQLTEPTPSPRQSASPVLSEASSTELPDAPPQKLLTYYSDGSLYSHNQPARYSLEDTMSVRDTSMKRRERSPAGSLSEYHDTEEHVSRPPLAIGATQSEVACGKRPIRPSTSQYDPLARHGYRQPSVIPSSEEDDVMEGVIHHAIESTPGRGQPRSPTTAVQELPQQALPPLPIQQPQQPQQYSPKQQLPSTSQPQQYLPTQQPQQYSPMQQSPSTPQPQQYLPMQQPHQYLPPQPSPPTSQPQQPQQQYAQYAPLWHAPQQYMPTHYAPQPYMPLPYPPQPPPQSNPALDNVATQMAKLTMAMERR